MVVDIVIDEENEYLFSLGDDDYIHVWSLPEGNHITEIKSLSRAATDPSGPYVVGIKIDYSQKLIFGLDNYKNINRLLIADYSEI
jgi:hypothetical protein